MQKTPSLNLYSQLNIDLFTPASTSEPRTTLTCYDRLLTHVYSLTMGVGGPYGRPLQPRTPRDTKARPSDRRNASSIAHSARFAEPRGPPTRTHGNIESQACGGAFATAAVVRIKAPLGTSQLHWPAHKQPHRCECCGARHIGRTRTALACQCVGKPARRPPLSPLRKVLRARP